MPALDGHPRSNGNGRRAPRSADVFVGAGGLSEGFKQAGFDLCFANDFDPDSAVTFTQSNPGVPFFAEPIQKLKTKDLLRVAGVEQGQLEVLTGGPPCQAYSVYNHQRGMHDERSGLFREYLRIVKGLMPRFVVMENVTGMTSVERGQAVDEIHDRLGKLGYHVEHRILKAEEYGVPQQRRRIFFIGSRDGSSILWPTPTHGDRSDDEAPLFAGERKPYVTVWDAIGDLPELGILEGDEVAEYTTEPFTEYQREMRRKSHELYNHVAPFLAEINRERLQYIPQGGSWRDLPERLLPAGMRRAKRSDHTKRYGRIRQDGLASTILTKCDLHWGAFIHPTQQRTFTVREAARLQSFPDHIRFAGPRSEQFRQVGNAVPPILARAVAEAVRAMLNAVGTRANVVSC